MSSRSTIYEASECIFGAKRKDLIQMYSSEFQGYFTGRRIIEQRITFITETLIVVGSDIEKD